MYGMLGFMVSTLHGELPPHDRDRVMNEFHSGKSKVNHLQAYTFFSCTVCMYVSYLLKFKLYFIVAYHD